MTHRYLAIGLGLLIAAHATVAVAQAKPQDRVLLLSEHNRLSNGLGSWEELGVQVSRHWSVREVAEAAVVRTRRFGQEDVQLRAGYSRPLSPDLTGSLQATVSPGHRVLPRGSIGGQLSYEFSKGWLAHAGGRSTSYDSGPVNQLNLAAERYVGPFSFLAGWSPSRALGQNASTGELRATWYYGEDSSVGMIATRGDEATQLGPGRVVVADVQGAALIGRQRLGAGSWLVWGVSRTRLEGFYTRTGATLGLQLAF